MIAIFFFNFLLLNLILCSEKSASIHKSKYDTLLQHERKRSNRNEELLQMLEDVQAKAAAMASNTEKLKRLKVRIVKRLLFFLHLLLFRYFSVLTVLP